MFFLFSIIYLRVIIEFFLFSCLLLSIKYVYNLKNQMGDFAGSAVVKNMPANAGDMGLSPSLGRSHMSWSN